MRNFISIFVILALVLTTSFAPSMSHAASHSHSKNAQNEVIKGHDCHGHSEAKANSDKTAQNDNDGSGKCCDKGICKCVGGNCHNGLSKIFGNSNNLLSAVSSSSLVFAFDSQFTDSAMPNRLKRPPKA